MGRSVTLLLLLMVCSAPCFKSYAQELYKGTVLDDDTGKGIPFVNIGVPSKALGTVADGEGFFELALDKKDFLATDEILFSAWAMNRFALQYQNCVPTIPYFMRYD